MKTTKTDSFLRWAGSKRQIRSLLASYWQNQYSSYIEPFVGSGNLFFYLQPQKSILGDINKELIDTYIQIKSCAEHVYNLLISFPTGEKAYYYIRSIKPDTLSPQEAAARFIYLNIFSFNGLYRTNLDGNFNVPYGRRKETNFPKFDRYLKCSQSLQNTELINGDFEIVLNLAKSGDFIYLDPPYRIKAKKTFNEYDKASFCANDVLRLRNHLEILSSRGVTFLLSYAKSEEAEILMEGYKRLEIVVRRNIAGFVKDRRNAEEWLITNSDSLDRMKENEHN